MIFLIRKPFAFRVDLVQIQIMNILIATDFSNAARNAALYGIELAKVLGAKVILFSAYHVPSPIPALNVSISEYGIMKDAEKILAEEADIIIKDNEIEMERVCDHGPAEKTINSIAKEKNAELIIIGMKGGGKNFRKVLGSTATSLTRSTDIPLIIVPEDAEFTLIKTIVFASDINVETNLQSLDELIKITQLFKSKLYVVKVITDKNKERFEGMTDTQQQLKQAYNMVDTSFQYPVDMDIRHALSEFIKENHVDMLAMMPHKHVWVERLFKKSETKEMIFHTHVPLLILPEISSKSLTSNNWALE